MAETNKKTGQYNINFRTYAIVASIIALWIVFSVLTNGSFLTPRNISNLFRQMSIVGILGAGALLVIVTGGIDLSVGVMAGFIGCLGAVLMTHCHWDTGVVVIAMLLAGTICGSVQGYIISYYSVPAFIATLGGQMILKGAVLALTLGTTITPINLSFLVFGQSYLDQTLGWILSGIVIIVLFYQMFKKRRNKKKYGFENRALTKDIIANIVYSILLLIFIYIMNIYMGVPFPVLIVLVQVLILTFVAEKTVFGRRLYAIGGNVEAVKYSGINVKKNLAMIYTINGTIAALAAIVLTSRQASGLPSSGQNMELDAIAAAVIGGASMTGGVGRVFGALFGAMLMATIDNGMSMLNMDTFWQYMVKGAILIFAVLFDIQSKSKDSK